MAQDLKPAPTVEPAQETQDESEVDPLEARTVDSGDDSTTPGLAGTGDVRAAAGVTSERTEAVGDQEAYCAPWREVLDGLPFATKVAEVLEWAGWQSERSDRACNEAPADPKPEKYQPRVGDVVSRLSGRTGIVLDVDPDGYATVFTPTRPLEKCYGPNLRPVARMQDHASAALAALYRSGGQSAVEGLCASESDEEMAATVRRLFQIQLEQT